MFWFFLVLLLIAAAIGSYQKQFGARDQVKALRRELAAERRLAREAAVVEADAVTLADRAPRVLP